MAEQTEVLTGQVIRRQSLHASITRACVECGAPGVYQRDESFIEKYPELYRPAWAGQQVGSSCPHCGRRRSEPEHLGELWSREWKVGNAFQRIMERVKTWLRWK